MVLLYPHHTISIPRHPSHHDSIPRLTPTTTGLSKDQIQDGTKLSVGTFSPDPQRASLTTTPHSIRGERRARAVASLPKGTGKGTTATHVFGYPSRISQMPSRLREEGWVIRSERKARQPHFPGAEDWWSLGSASTLTYASQDAVSRHLTRVTVWKFKRHGLRRASLACSFWLGASAHLNRCLAAQILH